MQYGTRIEYSTPRPSVAMLTLNEPRKRNPFSPELVDGAIAALKAIEKDEEVRAVVFNGAGPCFSAGADLRRMADATLNEDRKEYESILEFNRIVWEFPKPTIAAVHGYALGAGANLVSWCDLAVAEKNAYFGYPEVKAGVAAATVVAGLLRHMGRKDLNELVLTGKSITATEARRLGFINHVVDGSAIEHACDWAADITQLSPHAISATKEVVVALTDMEYRKSLNFARDIRVISRMAPDFRESLDRHTVKEATNQEDSANQNCEIAQ